MSSVLTYAMQSGSPVEWAGAIGSILAGLGSFAAVVVALSLARDAQKMKLKKSFIAMTKATKANITANPVQHPVFIVSIANVGPIPVTVSVIGFGCKRRLFSWGHPAKKYDFFTAHECLPDSDEIMVTLANGTENAWEFSQKRIVPTFAKYLKTEKDIKLLRCIISSMHGDMIVIVPDDSVVKVLLKALRDKHAKSATTEK